MQSDSKFDPRTESEINTESEPTYGGWRLTDHYQVIKEINATGVYIPFSDSWPDDE